MDDNSRLSRQERGKRVDLALSVRVRPRLSGVKGYRCDIQTTRIRIRDIVAMSWNDSASCSLPEIVLGVRTLARRCNGSR